MSSLLARRRGARGFTLLEVMISIGILAVSLMAIADLNGGAVRMSAYSNRLTTAVQLARGKLLDVQQMLRKDGLHDSTWEYKCDFDDEEQPDYSCKVLVVKPPKMQLDAKALAPLAAGALGLPMGGDPSGNGGPQADPMSMLGPLAGQADMLLQQMTDTIDKSVRELRITVSWKSGARTESFDLVEHIIIMPNAAQAAAAAAQAATPGQQGQQGQQGTGQGGTGGTGPPTTPNLGGSSPADLLRRFGGGGK